MITPTTFKETNLSYIVGPKNNRYDARIAMNINITDIAEYKLK